MNLDFLPNAISALDAALGEGAFFVFSLTAIGGATYAISRKWSGRPHHTDKPDDSPDLGRCIERLEAEQRHTAEDVRDIKASLAAIQATLMGRAK